MLIQMMTNSTQETAMTNPYIEQCVQKGYTPQECQVVSKLCQQKTFPYTLHGHTFETEEDYYSALHEFLNGN